MEAKGIEVGNGVKGKKYDNGKLYEFIHITNCFPGLRGKDKKLN
tara:strand:- start:309 stop:440 length:132 start_codon:yes stop_codon:yes gene_type:complete